MTKRLGAEVIVGRMMSSLLPRDVADDIERNSLEVNVHNLGELS